MKSPALKTAVEIAPQRQARIDALEEAARVAEGEAYGFPPEQLTEHGTGYERACKDIATAIRAMISRRDIND